MTVPSLDVLDGREASLRKRGYILEPRASVIIHGFRVSGTAVRTSRLGKYGSTSVDTCREGATSGVVHVAAFQERRHCRRMTGSRASARGIGSKD